MTRAGAADTYVDNERTQRVDAAELQRELPPHLQVQS